jgi:PAS domain-containing protein
MRTDGATTGPRGWFKHPAALPLALWAGYTLCFLMVPQSLALQLGGLAAVPAIAMAALRGPLAGATHAVVAAAIFPGMLALTAGTAAAAATFASATYATGAVLTLAFSVFVGWIQMARDDARIAQGRLAQRDADMEAIRAVSEEARLSTTVERTYAAVVRAVAAGTGFKRVRIERHDSRQRVMVVLGAAGDETVMDAVNPVPKTLSGLVAMTNETLQVTEVATDSRYTHMVEAQRGLGTFVGVPIRSQGEVEAVMCLADPRILPLSAERVRWLEVLSNFAGYAMDQKRLRGEIKVLEGARDEAQVAGRRTVDNERIMLEQAEALAVAEARYEALLSGSGEALILIDEDSGRIVEANAAAATLAGYELDGLAGLDRESVLRSSGDTHNLIRKDGSSMVVALKSVVVRGHASRMLLVQPLEPGKALRLA